MVSGQNHAPATLPPGPVWTIWWREQSLAPAGIQTPDRHFIAWSLYHKWLPDIEAFCPQSLYVYVKVTVPTDNTNRVRFVNEIKCVLYKAWPNFHTFYTIYYTPPVHNNTSVQWYNIYNQVTLRLHISTVNGHLHANEELFLRHVLHWPEDDRLRSKYVAVMWPDCIYYIIVLMYCTVLTVYNILYIIYCCVLTV